MVAISILDQSPIEHNEAVSDGLARTVELAKLAEQLNYKRYFVAEHHNMDEVVGTSPEILIMHLLNQTKHIVVGSGGVMLQHYSPFKVIEQFHLISQLAPGRVNLGVGKAPGGVPLATKALQAELKSPQTTFNDKFHVLNQFNNHSFNDNDEYQQLHTAIRSNEVPTPEIFLLGGSEQSAQLAIQEQVGFIYAFFINSNINVLREAIKSYKSQQPKGKFILAVSALISENTKDQQLIEEGRTNYALHFKDGRKLTLGSRAQVDTFKAQSDEPFKVEENKTQIFTGTAKEIYSQLNALNANGDIDEFMIHMPVQNHDLRVKTVKQLAVVFNKEKEKEVI